MSSLTDFARYGAATVHEAMGRRGIIDIPLIQIVPGSRVAGPARTVKCGQNDNLMVHAAVSSALPGEVLVLTMPEPAPVALVGELIAIQAAYRHVAAILVDAAVRDVEELVSIGLPIWARWVRVSGATKDSVGKVNEAVTVGGTKINPGDIVVLDADGGVVVPAGEQESALKSAAARVAHEDDAREHYRSGSLTYDLLGLRAKVEGPSQP